MNLLNALELAAGFAKKPLTTSEKNLIAKLESFGVELPYFAPGQADDYRANPFGGGARVTQPAAALYDFCIASYANYSGNLAFSYRGHAFPVSIYDRTRYLFLKLWPEEYQKLLD